MKFQCIEGCRGDEDWTFWNKTVHFRNKTVQKRNSTVHFGNKKGYLGGKGLIKKHGFGCLRDNGKHKKQIISCNDLYGLFDIKTLDYTEMKMWMMLLYRFNGDWDTIYNITIKEIKTYSDVKRNDKGFIFEKLKSTIDKVNDHMMLNHDKGMFFTDFKLDKRVAKITMNQNYKDIYTSMKPEKGKKLIYFDCDEFFKLNSVQQQRFYLGVRSKRGFGFWRIKEHDLFDLLDIEDSVITKEKNRRIKTLVSKVGKIISESDASKSGKELIKERKKNMAGEYYYDFKWVNKSKNEIEREV